MKTFHQFISELKTIPYYSAKKHNVYNKGKVTNIGFGRSVPKRSLSSAAEDSGE